MKPPLEDKPGAAGASRTPKNGGPPEGDRVQISDASKRLKTDLGDKLRPGDAPATEDALAKKRLTVQERIASGFYKRPEVINHIARRIIDLLVRK